MKADLYNLIIKTHTRNKLNKVLKFKMKKFFIKFLIKIVMRNKIKLIYQIDL